MTILHICNDLFGSRVHANLYVHLARRGVPQIVFAPLRRQMDDSRDVLPEDVPLIRAKVVRPFHRFFYHIKRRTIFRSADQFVDWKSCDLIHASTFFSDGGVAYKAFRKYHIPYIITVRGADVNHFLRLLPHAWLSGWRILLHARKIVFVSKALMDKFSASRVIRPILSRIQHKFILQPNGIDDFWCENVRREISDNQKVLYVGDFTDNKNVGRLIEAVVALRKKPRFSQLQLTLVGGGRNETDDILRLIEQNGDAVRYLGSERNKDRLRDIYREHSIFAMVSLHETFGLVYVEALSQDLALLYTKGQGIDGLFGPEVGVASDPYSVDDIERGLEKLLEERGSFTNENIDFEQFRWSSIAARYQRIYEEELGE